MLSLLVRVEGIRTEPLAVQPASGFSVDKTTSVQVFENEELSLQFLVEKPALTGHPKSKSRMHLEKSVDVFEVDAALADFFTQGTSTFREKKLLDFSVLTVNKLEWLFPDDTVISRFEKKPDNSWSGTDGHLLDSLAMEMFLSSLSRVASAEFADDFDLLSKEENLYQRLYIFTSDSEEPIAVYCYFDEKYPGTYVLTSSQNQEGFFRSDAAGIYNLLFRSWMTVGYGR
jgi:hypothetical protein